MYQSGMGYVHEIALNTHNHFDMFVVSANRVESRAEDDCEEKERNAIVANMAKMTITTISSTSVKALLLY
jgi:hypothetical protein